MGGVLPAPAPTMIFPSLICLRSCARIDWRSIDGGMLDMGKIALKSRMKAMAIEKVVVVVGVERRVMT